MAEQDPDTQQFRTPTDWQAPAAPGAMGPYRGAPLVSQASGPVIGRVRGTGSCILLTVVTLGFYSWYWFYAVHSEMKAHKGTGLGGGVGLLLAIFITVVMPFITSQEVGELYERHGLAKPVSAVTGLWNFPGSFLIIGPLVWFIKTNGALNAYWRSQGAI